MIVKPIQLLSVADFPKVVQDSGQTLAGNTHMLLLINSSTAQEERECLQKQTINFYSSVLSLGNEDYAEKN